MGGLEIAVLVLYVSTPLGNLLRVTRQRQSAARLTASALIPARELSFDERISLERVSVASQNYRPSWSFAGGGLPAPLSKSTMRQSPGRILATRRHNEEHRACEGHRRQGLRPPGKIMLRMC